MSNNVFEKLAVFIKSLDELSPELIETIMRLFSEISRHIRQNETEGIQILNQGYLDNFMERVCDYITADISHNPELGSTQIMKLDSFGSIHTN